MFKLLERYMIQQLGKTDLTQKQIRQRTGVSERTQRRIRAEHAVTQANDTNFRKLRSIGRPSTADVYEQLVRDWLAGPRQPADGPLKAIEVYTLLKAQGYSGGKTAIYDLVHRIRPPQARVPLVRFEGLPAEFSQHDFGQRKVTFEDGTTQVVHFFASRLKYSRTIDVSIVDNEQLETVIRCLLRAFERFGGMPLKAVFDNMTTVVHSRTIDAEGQVQVVWNQKFGQFVIDCGFIPVACWPYRPQQKGSVENLVGFVKSNFFGGRRLRDRQDLREQLEAWVCIVNQERKSDATGEIPALRLKQEPLKPCAHQASTYAFKVTAIVRPTARVCYKRMEYSVPAAYIGQTVTLHLQQELLKIYLADRCLATHPRFPENGHSSVLAEHAEELFVFQRGKPYAQRQLLLDLDPSVEPYMTELVHRRPMRWEVDIDLMYQLYRHLGRTDFLAAVALAAEQRCFGGEYLVVIAEEGLPQGVAGRRWWS
jgi:transposase